MQHHPQEEEGKQHQPNGGRTQQQPWLPLGGAAFSSPWGGAAFSLNWSCLLLFPIGGTASTPPLPENVIVHTIVIS